MPFVKRTESPVMETYRIEIEGLVQGVGFRPFIYKLATSLGLEGTVENLNTGVRIFVNTSNGVIEKFIDALSREAPQQSQVESVRFDRVDTMKFSGFSIISSINLSDEVTRISPDIAVCPDCLADMERQQQRIDYPLVNCTNCGPRFSIIKALPYDRQSTTMSHFKMCPLCREEYGNLNDRRFHAQPVACNNCGPVYSMLIDGTIVEGTDEIASRAAALVDSGKSIALKGTGGYHILCDATNESAVSTLRMAKGREGKPFAVMCRNIDTAAGLGELSEREVESLNSWQKPVIIVDGGKRVAKSVSNGLGTVGVILPYMPFHYLLFRKLKTDVILFTSANLAEEPVIKDDEEAITGLGQLTSAIIGYNREIYNRTDDSVGRLIAGEVRLMRRSRGFAPTPVRIGSVSEGIFGAGAELSNCFSVGKGKEVILSQHIGDLRNAPTMGFYETSYRRFADMFRFTPQIVARDFHPDYLSSVFADRLSLQTGAPVNMVQHHHAHIVSCMSENGISGKVVGVAMDGVGLGSDGKIWGGEFMLADRCDFERLAHFEYVTIAGGDSVSFEPWRSALSYLNRYGLIDTVPGNLQLIGMTGPERVKLYVELVRKGINSSEYSSAGRLFDAVAALIGADHTSTFHAEAPMRLESQIVRGVRDAYEFDIRDGVISFEKTFSGIISDMSMGKNPGEISAKFHNSVAKAIVAGVKYCSDSSGVRNVALSGGTLQNRYLTEAVYEELKSHKYSVYFHRNIPANDGGLSLGQVSVAAARREAGIIG
ncbi:MAG: carbamoyltransferase HypF [Bacteroidales bacterium]|nr:carbamoyltransferase HypF [Bacteroidales bacterium]